MRPFALDFSLVTFLPFLTSDSVASSIPLTGVRNLLYPYAAFAPPIQSLNFESIFIFILGIWTSIIAARFDRFGCMKQMWPYGNLLKGS